MWIAAGGTLVAILALWFAARIGYALGKMTYENRSEEDCKERVSTSYVEGFDDGYNIGADKFYINMN